MDFIQIYNEDFSYNSLLNVNYLIKINDLNRIMKSKHETYVPVEYCIGGNVATALIKEVDYALLREEIRCKKTALIDKKQTKTTKKEGI